MCEQGMVTYPPRVALTLHAPANQQVVVFRLTAQPD